VMQVKGLAGSTAAAIKREEQANNRRSMGTTFREIAQDGAVLIIHVYPPCYNKLDLSYFPPCL
jgi:hypothetical protein